MPKRFTNGTVVLRKVTTGSAAAFSTWSDIGPCVANSICVGAGGIASPTKITVQGALSTAMSTAAIRTIATRTSTQLTATIHSTVAFVVTRVRFRTTGSTAASATQLVYLACGE